MSAIYGDCKVDCTTDETKLWLSPIAKQCENPCSGYTPVYQDLSTCHDWPVKKDLIDLPIRVKENKNALPIIDSFGAQNKDLSVSLQTLLAKVEVHLQIMQSTAKRMLETILGLTLLVPRVTNINFRPAISIHHQGKSLKVDCEQSLFSQSGLSSAGLERAKWLSFPSASCFLLLLALLDFLARVTILRDCSQSSLKEN